MPMRPWSPLLLALALPACTVGPDYKRPAVAGETGHWIAPSGGSPADLAAWRALGDPSLSALIDRAMAANLDIREAEARLREARAARDAAVGRQLPEIDATGSAQRQQLSKNGQLPVGNIPGLSRRFSLFDLGFDASWEIDLWGGARRAIEAAGRRADAATARIEDVRLQIAAEVVRNYAELRAAQASLASARKDAEAQQQIAILVRQRFAAGEAARLDQTRAEGQARTTLAAVPGFEADARQAAYRLALLTGRPPEAALDLLAMPAPVPVPPGHIGVGLRSEILRRRPDVRAAEADLAAASADIGVETANLFPRLALMGSVGQQSRSVGDLPSAASTHFQIGPSLRWPIFDFGRIRADIRAADARADQAAARYERAVLSALSDSETAANRFAAAQTALADRQAARDQSTQSLDLAEQRYRAGEDDLLTLLDAQSADAAADRALTQARAQALEAYVALLKALGGPI
jgi:NodT family efflux transporter outer membrane factor (OMF) lipoprotein